MHQQQVFFSVIIVATLVIAMFKISSDIVNTGHNLAKTHCAKCHDFSNQNVNRKGPYLWGIFNRRAGTAKGYEYSDAFSQIVSERGDFSWTEAELDSLIANPGKFMPGIKMARSKSDTKHIEAFGGIHKEGLRTELISYLRTLK
ncbi:MAG: hypothetical protein HQL69_08370 [Magnetococcales bacterium]|nr:hypothetical protein [Magnetococcales bacterium]